MSEGLWIPQLLAGIRLHVSVVEWEFTSSAVIALRYYSSRLRPNECTIHVMCEGGPG